MNSLPDLPLLTVLDKIPLEDLLRNVNLVCRRWRDIVSSARDRRRTLELNFDENEPDERPIMPSVNGITLKYWNVLLADRLIALFINISSLSVNSGVYEKDYDNVLHHLLNHPWSHKLTSLKLASTFGDVRLVEAINSLPSLKKLSLDSLSETDYQFPILERLEVFRFSFPMPIRPYTWFEQFANANQNLRRVEFTIFGLDSDAINSLLMFSPQLARKFTRLFEPFLSGLSDIISKIPELLSHFSSLQEIGIVFDSKLSFVEPFRCLIQLQQLTTLNFSFNHKFLASLNLSGQTDLIPLKSVNKLKIKMRVDLDKIEDFPQLMRSIEFGHLFPNLKVTDLEVQICQTEDEHYTDQHFDQLSRAVSDIMIAALKKCADLQKVYCSISLSSFSNELSNIDGFQAYAGTGKEWKAVAIIRRPTLN